MIKKYKSQNKWKLNNPDKVKEIRRKWRKDNKNKTKIYDRKYDLKKLYNITLDIYYELYKKQGGLCAICLKKETIKSRTLAVDHCHKTNVVRGLLCGKCNLGIGCFGDNIEIIKKSIEYLERNGVSQ